MLNQISGYTRTLVGREAQISFRAWVEVYFLSCFLKAARLTAILTQIRIIFDPIHAVHEGR